MAVSILMLLVLIPLIFGVPILLGLIIYLLVRSKNSDQAGSVPARSNDKTLIKILIAILVIPIALIFLVILLVFFLGMARQSGSGGFASAYGAVPVTEYLKTSEQRETIEHWLNSCSDTPDSTCYVLQYTPEPEEAKDYQYLIYIPEASECINMDTDLEKKLFSKWIFQVEIQCAEDSEEQLLFFVSHNATERPEGINILYNGQEVDTEITHTEQPLEK